MEQEAGDFNTSNASASRHPPVRSAPPPPPSRPNLHARASAPEDAPQRSVIYGATVARAPPVAMELQVWALRGGRLRRRRRRRHRPCPARGGLGGRCRCPCRGGTEGRRRWLRRRHHRHRWHRVPPCYPERVSGKAQMPLVEQGGVGGGGALGQKVLRSSGRCNAASPELSRIDCHLGFQGKVFSVRGATFDLWPPSPTVRHILFDVHS